MTGGFPLEAREEKSAYNKAKLEKAKALVELKKIENKFIRLNKKGGNLKKIFAAREGLILYL